MSLKHRIFNLFVPLFKPRMIWGYKNPDGKSLQHVRISTHTYIDHPENLVLDDSVYIGHHNYIEASHHVSIDEGCQITNFISITTHSSHQAIRLYGKQYVEFSEHKGYITGSIQIGRYSFIGPHSVIMPNTRIGKGSLIAAYSYVQGDFPDFAIIKGNPAQVVGSTKDTDATLLQEFPELKEFYQEWQ